MTVRCELKKNAAGSKGALSLILKGEYSDKDLPLRTLLLKHRLPLTGKVEIPPTASYDFFALMATGGELYYQNKRLLVDLYGKSKLVYKVGDGGKVQCVVEAGAKSIPLQEVTAIGAGNPHWYLHGMMIRFLHSEIFWSDFDTAFHSPEKLSPVDLESDDPDAPEVVYEGNGQQAVAIAAKPLPFLKLHDRTGAFADLWFLYSNGVRVPIHETLSQASVKRDRQAESDWEKDLLETGFQKKTVGRSHYFCPMDKVGKTLSFLLDLGWVIFDAHDSVVVKFKDRKLLGETVGETIHISGQLQFGEHQVDLKDVYGAFTRRDRFVALGEGHVGWLDGAALEGIDEIDADSESGGELTLRRHAFGSLEKLFGGDAVEIDAPLSRLKELLDVVSAQMDVELPLEFLADLRPYQQQGVAWMTRLQQLGLHGLLADDMGLGKTVQVIAFLSTRPQTEPTLIVVPTTLVFNWQKEFEKFLPSRKVVIHQGVDRSRNPDDYRNADIVITTYTTVRNDLSFFCQIPFAHLILDEAQAIKNDKTQIAQAIYRLKAAFRLSMTGTPIENRFSELWSQFRFLIPDLFEGLEQFEADAAMDSRKIKRRVKPFILRRDKREVAKDLPEKIEQVVWVEMGESQRALYEGFLAQVKGSKQKKSTMEILEAILRLRQLCCHPLLLSKHFEDDATLESAKFAALFADLETLFAERQKVLVYSQFTSMLSLMIKEAASRGWKFSVLDGTTKDRESQVQRFQEDPEISLFFISLKAGGAGLNLTAADAVLLYDPWWNEAVERQAIDRAHRMGRSSPVLAKRYVVRESVEEKMMKIKQAKNVLANDIFEEDLTSLRLTAEELEQLLL